MTTRRSFLKAFGYAAAASFAVTPRITTAAQGMAPSPETTAQLSKLFAPKGMPRFNITRATMRASGLGTVQLDIKALFVPEQFRWLRDAQAEMNVIPIRVGNDSAFPDIGIDIDGDWLVRDLVVDVLPNSLLEVDVTLAMVRT